MTDLQVPVFLVAGVAALAGVVIGLPAWRTYQSRQAMQLEEDRYLEWRGRARPPGAASSSSSAMTARERWRIVAGVGLGIVAVACLVIGLSAG